MKKSSFVEGTVIATTAIIITKILGMLYVIPFYATIGDKGGPLYAYAYNIYVIFLDISAAGLPIAISKLVNEYNTLGMQDAKVRTYKIGRNLLVALSAIAFLILMFFARPIAMLILGDLSGGNTIEEVTFVIRCIAPALLVIPFLSVSKGYLQGHKIINVSSISQIIEQVVRIVIILGGSYIALNVLGWDLKSSVGIALFGATVGGTAAVSYIYKKMHDNKMQLGLHEGHKKDLVTNKEIVKKIINYAVPFIIIDTVASIYNFINMVFISRMMNYLNYAAADVEFITSAMTTWAGKINMIVTSIAIGMTVSLIPSIVNSFTLKKMDDVESKVNSALQIILVISIPMTVGVALLAGPIWSVFYGTGQIKLGTIILATGIFTALFTNLFLVTNSTLQGLNKFKTVYKVAIVGFVLNAILDIPLILLFDKLGLPPYLGATFATVIGLSLSVVLALKTLRKDYNFRYGKTWRVLLSTILPTLAMIVIVLGVQYFLPLNINDKLSSIIYIAISAVFGALAYLIVGWKMRIFHEAFGKSYLDQIIKKLIPLKKDKTN